MSKTKMFNEQYNAVVSTVAQAINEALQSVEPKVKDLVKNLPSDTEGKVLPYAEILGNAGEKVAIKHIQDNLTSFLDTPKMFDKDPNLKALLKLYVDNLNSTNNAQDIVRFNSFIEDLIASNKLNQTSEESEVDKWVKNTVLEYLPNTVKKDCNFLEEITNIYLAGISVYNHAANKFGSTPAVLSIIVEIAQVQTFTLLLETMRKIYDLHDKPITEMQVILCHMHIKDNFLNYVKKHCEYHQMRLLDKPFMVESLATGFVNEAVGEATTTHDIPDEVVDFVKGLSKFLKTFMEDK